MAVIGTNTSAPFRTTVALRNIMARSLSGVLPSPHGRRDDTMMVSSVLGNISVAPQDAPKPAETEANNATAWTMHGRTGEKFLVLLLLALCFLVLFGIVIADMWRKGRNGQFKKGYREMKKDQPKRLAKGLKEVAKSVWEAFTDLFRRVENKRRGRKADVEMTLSERYGHDAVIARLCAKEGVAKQNVVKKDVQTEVVVKTVARTSEQSHSGQEEGKGPALEMKSSSDTMTVVEGEKSTIENEKTTIEGEKTAIEDEKTTIEEEKTMVEEEKTTVEETTTVEEKTMAKDEEETTEEGEKTAGEMKRELKEEPGEEDWDKIEPA